MRNTQTCPKCSSRKLFVIGSVHQPDHESRFTSLPMAVTSHGVATGKSGILGSPTERVIAGTFESWVCSECGYTEWYARNARAALARLAADPTTGVHFVDGDTQQGPYR